MTLTDITDFLMQEDELLKKKITMSCLAFESLKIQLCELQDAIKKIGIINPRVNQILNTGAEFLK